MKYTAAAALFLSIVANNNVNAFAPNPALVSTSRFVGTAVITQDSAQVISSTSLNMGLRSFFRRRRQQRNNNQVKELNESEREIRALFTLWNDALATGDSRIVAKRYAKNAVLLPTVSDTPRTDYDSIKDYFDLFLTKKPQGRITEGHITMGNGWAQDVGIYEFSLGADNTKVKARYSFVYVKEDGKWKISHHHSSMMPEGIDIGKQVTEEEVKNLFFLWNDALATGDPATVAARYSKDAVLLPTVSDVPRTDFDSIQDYFVSFLKKKPQGKILSSDVIIGTNWAQDAGIYEFTMGADGSKVKARYSFIYVFEDGQWKISHHHSSVMPEGVLGVNTLSESEARGLFELWNDALATLDSDKVTQRYSKEAVLLPTVSDKPRTNYGTIKDYFDGFLLKQPRGTILEGEITCGNGWCQDAGIYEFAMGEDGSKVQARYSFIYVFEDGEWKISHHHSSIMPEPFLAFAAEAEEIRQEKEKARVPELVKRLESPQRVKVPVTRIN